MFLIAFFFGLGDTLDWHTFPCSCFFLISLGASKGGDWRLFFLFYCIVSTDTKSFKPSSHTGIDTDPLDETGHREREVQKLFGPDELKLNGSNTITCFFSSSHSQLVSPCRSVSVCACPKDYTRFVAAVLVRNSTP